MKKIATISLIDDDKIYQFITKRLIESTGAVDQVLQFHDGEEAFEYLKANQQNDHLLPDLILLDLQMPYMDGWQFLERYIELGFAKNITIYIASSSISKHDQERTGYYNEVKGFLVKPINKKEFIAIIEEL